jgi:hypothetical protein
VTGGYVSWSPALATYAFGRGVAFSVAGVSTNAATRHREGRSREPSSASRQWHQKQRVARFLKGID